MQLGLVPPEPDAVPGRPPAARGPENGVTSRTSSTGKLLPSSHCTQAGTMEPSRPKCATTSTSTLCTRTLISSVSVLYSMHSSIEH